MRVHSGPVRSELSFPKINYQKIVKHFQDIATKEQVNLLSIYGRFFQNKFCQEHCAGDLGQISQILSYFFIILPPHNDHNINQLNGLTLQQGKAQLTERFVGIITGAEAGILKQGKCCVAFILHRRETGR